MNDKNPGALYKSFENDRQTKIAKLLFYMKVNNLKTSINEKDKKFKEEKNSNILTTFNQFLVSVNKITNLQNNYIDSLKNQYKSSTVDEVKTLMQQNLLKEISQIELFKNLKFYDYVSMIHNFLESDLETGLESFLSKIERLLIKYDLKKDPRVLVELQNVLTEIDKFFNDENSLLPKEEIRFHVECIKTRLKVAILPMLLGRDMLEPYEHIVDNSYGFKYISEIIDNVINNNLHIKHEVITEELNVVLEKVSLVERLCSIYSGSLDSFTLKRIQDQLTLIEECLRNDESLSKYENILSIRIKSAILPVVFPLKEHLVFKAIMDPTVKVINQQRRESSPNEKIGDVYSFIQVARTTLNRKLMKLAPHIATDFYQNLLEGYGRFPGMAVVSCRFTELSNNPVLETKTDENQSTTTGNGTVVC